MTVLTARRLVTGVGTIEYPVIHVDEAGTIAEIESDPSLRGTDTLASGFFDVHTHGAAGYDVMDDNAAALPAIARFFATRGVSHFLPTTVTAPIDQTLRSLEHLATAIEGAGRNEDVTRAQPLGIHLEGPFVSHAKRGVHPVASIQPPSIALFDRFCEAARGHICLMTLAPEEPGALEVIQHATACEVRVSLGHSNAMAAEARAGIAAGAVSATHTFNAMRALDHREPGIAGVVLDDEDLYAELICDGVHVAPEMVRLWLRAKGPERGILVTDSMSAAGMGDGMYSLGGMAVQVIGGVCRAGEALAGSVLTLDRAVANLQQMTGSDLATAVRLASINPARMTGFDGIGEVRAGTRADLNRFNEKGQFTGSYLRGVLVS